MRSIGKLACLLVFGAACAAPAEDLAIIVPKSCPFDNVSRTELRKIFLQQTQKDSNGLPFQVFMREKGSSERACALSSIYHLSEPGLDAYFLRLLYIGDSQSVPRIVPSGVVMKRVVAKTPGAIGYISVNECDDTVKVLKVNDILPGGDKYSIQLPIK